MGAFPIAAHCVCRTYLCLDPRNEKQYADIHNLLCVGVLPDNMDIAAATTAPKSQSKHDAFRGSVSICQGMMANFLYVVFRIFIGIRFASV